MHPGPITHHSSLFSWNRHEDNRATLHFLTAEEWRAWLRANHAVEKQVWLLIYKKHTEIPCVSFGEAAEEALCFGWIDSMMKRIDDEKYVLRYTPRRRGSIWSEGNKKRVAGTLEERWSSPLKARSADRARAKGGPRS